MPSKSNTKLLIAGWRGIHHSFALLNQHQILALLRCKDITLFHKDMPFFMAHWNAKDHNPGFSDSDFKKIMDLADTDEAKVDCVYRICSPMYPPNVKAKKTITFGITELNFTKNNLFNSDQSIDRITAGRNLVVTSSRWSRDRLVDFGFPEEKLRVVSCGVDLDTFHPLGSDEFRAQRTTLGIAEETVVFVNVGVPTWNKGVDLLIRTFALVNQKFPNTRLFLKDSRGLYGYPVENVLKEIELTHPGLLTTQTLSAISTIPINLTQGQLRALYGMADWYVSSYRAEGFNLPVLEAQACGTPVIASSGGATDDFCSTPGVRKIASVFNRGRLRDGDESCWVEPNISALESLMLDAARDGPRQPHATDLLRQAARKNSESYSWDVAAGALVNLARD